MMRLFVDGAPETMVYLCFQLFMKIISRTRPKDVNNEIFECVFSNRLKLVWEYKHNCVDTKIDTKIEWMLLRNEKLSHGQAPYHH